jgi:hypothetical protein
VDFGRVEGELGGGRMGLVGRWEQVLLVGVGGWGFGRGGFGLGQIHLLI